MPTMAADESSSFSSSETDELLLPDTYNSGSPVLLPDIDSSESSSSSDSDDLVSIIERGYFKAKMLISRQFSPISLSSDEDDDLIVISANNNQEPIHRPCFLQHDSVEPPDGSEVFKKMVKMFPDAQHAYLQTESARLSNEKDVKKFILRCFAYHDYPSKVVSQEKVDQVNKANAVERHELLLALLPDADPRWIHDESSTVKSVEEIESLAEKAAAEKNYPKKEGTKKRRLSDTEKNSLDPRFLSLKEMLPDADPKYLESAAKKMRSNEDVQSFVLSAVETKNYPKLDAYLKRREYQDMWLKYVKDFSVEEYLALFPDPIEYFYFEKKGSKNMPSKFLLHRYRQPVEEINYMNLVYEEMKYSITRTCDRLDYEFSDTPKKYYEWDGSTEFDITVLQEIAFIQNKREIAHYILAKTRQKEIGFNQAKERGELVECMCCFDEQLQEDIAVCPEGHTFCVSCIRRGAEVSIGEGKTSFPCYSDECGAEFSLDVLKRVLHPDMFSRLLVRKQYEEVQAAGMTGLETCPFCEFCYIPDVAEKIFSCLNPLCKKLSCRECKKMDHLPFTCEESAAREETESKMKKYVEEKMTEALIRTCPDCNTKFIKEDGCNMMTCKCGTKICYVCNQRLTDHYYHFEMGACKLYESTTVLHVTNVIAEGRKAKRHVEAANPGFSLTNDPTAGPSS